MIVAAVRFVLSDIFTSMTATERQKLLHVSISSLLDACAQPDKDLTRLIGNPPDIWSQEWPHLSR